MIIRLAAYLGGVLRSSERKEPPAAVPEPDLGHLASAKAAVVEGRMADALAADSVRRMDRFDQMLMQALDHGVA